MPFVLAGERSENRPGWDKLELLCGATFQPRRIDDDLALIVDTLIESEIHFSARIDFLLLGKKGFHEKIFLSRLSGNSLLGFCAAPKFGSI